MALLLSERPARTVWMFYFLLLTSFSFSGSAHRADREEAAALGRLRCHVCQLGVCHRHTHPEGKPVTNRHRRAGINNQNKGPVQPAATHRIYFKSSPGSQGESR